MLFLVLPSLAVTCHGEGPRLPLCSSTVTQEPTGDLAEDLVGAWGATINEEDWHHPIASMAPIPGWGWVGHRIWMFRSDGTGHVWTVVSAESGSDDNDEEFVWKVVNQQLVVNDLPPATVEVYSDEGFLLHPIDETVEAEKGSHPLRCELEVPENVRGFNP